ncbi:MAG: peptidylprolyl isomerase [Methylococcales bacterium]|nr:peptidylprolyl isomerase [Methylococcales bacterium]
MKKYFALSLFLLLAVSSIVHSAPFVDIQTDKGSITVELLPDKAPITVANFLSYVDSGFYDNTIFHRVIKDFMIQAGNSSVNSVQQTTLAPIKLESNNGLKNQRGTIAMARTSVPDSAKAQFFINSVDNDNLNYKNNSNPGYAVFGRVTEGMDVVDSISVVKTGLGDVPNEEVTISTVRPREGDLVFNGLQKKYAVGDKINLSLKESGMKREIALDLWVAVLLPNGNFLYLSKDGSFSTSTSIYKSAVKVEETSHQVLTLTVPKGLGGQYTFYAIFNRVGADISDLTHSLRSNIASSKTSLTNK